MSKMLGDEWVPLDDLAQDEEVHVQTVRRWKNQPNGLPVAKRGKKEFVHIPTYRAWMLSRLRKRNPRRQRAGQAA